MAAAPTHCIHPEILSNLSPQDQDLASELWPLAAHFHMSPHSTMWLNELPPKQTCFLLQHQQNPYGGKGPEMELRKSTFLGFLNPPDFNGDGLDQAERDLLYDLAHNKTGDLSLAHAAGKKRLTDYTQPLKVKELGTKVSVEWTVTPLPVAVCAPEYASLPIEVRQEMWRERLGHLRTAFKTFLIMKQSSNDFCANATCLRLACEKEEKGESSICSACRYKRLIAYLKQGCDDVFRSGINPDRVLFSNAKVLPTPPTENTENKKRKGGPSPFPWFN